MNTVWAILAVAAVMVVVVVVVQRFGLLQCRRKKMKKKSEPSEQPAEQESHGKAHGEAERLESSTDMERTDMEIDDKNSESSLVEREELKFTKFLPERTRDAKLGEELELDGVEFCDDPQERGDGVPDGIHQDDDDVQDQEADHQLMHISMTDSFHSPLPLRSFGSDVVVYPNSITHLRPQGLRASSKEEKHQHRERHRSTRTKRKHQLASTQSQDTSTKMPERQRHELTYLSREEEEEFMQWKRERSGSRPSSPPRAMPSFNAQVFNKFMQHQLDKRMTKGTISRTEARTPRDQSTKRTDKVQARSSREERQAHMASSVNTASDVVPAILVIDMKKKLRGTTTRRAPASPPSVMSHPDETCSPKFLAVVDDCLRMKTKKSFSRAEALKEMYGEGRVRS
eukprot:749066-Hanusia_phi.AAC.1